MNKRTRKVLLVPLAVLSAAFLAAAALVAADGLRDEDHPADVTIVPGNTVERDGQPSARLEARQDKALELYQGGMFGHVIVSGGAGAEGFDEVEVMKRYLVSRGVPEERFIADGGGLRPT